MRIEINLKFILYVLLFSRPQLNDRGSIVYLHVGKLYSYSTVIAARIENNITQEELAQRTGIRQSNISRIESGAVSPTIETLARLASGLGKTLKIEFR